MEPSPPCAPESARGALARREILDNFERDLHHGRDHELREVLQRLQRVLGRAAIAATQKTVDLKVRQTHPRASDRARMHIFLCLLACYVE